MKRLMVLPALVAGLLSASSARAQTPASLDLSGTWKSNRGDDTAWATPAFDDSHWKNIKIPGSAQEQGSPGAAGFAWYRRSVDVPAAWESDPLVKQEKVLRLDLGRIADAYEVYWNGSVISRGGTLPTASDTMTPAAYPARAGVPADKTSFGAQNLLAVRVFSASDAGGILEGPLAIRKPVFADFITVEVRTEKNRVEFTGPEGLPFEVVASNDGPADWDNGSIKVSLLDGSGRPLSTSTVPGKVGSGKRNITGIHLKQEELNPGVYTVAVEAVSGGDTIARAMHSLVYNPGGIRHRGFSTPAAIEAFKKKNDEFWTATLAALAPIPLDPKASDAPGRSTEEVKVQKVSFAALGGQTIHGWLALPSVASPASRVPAVVVLPGFGNGPVEPPMALARKGFAVLAINLHGSEVDAASYPSEIDSYARGGYDDPNTIVLRAMVAAGLRAVDYLAARPDVNTERIGVVGISQGGALAVNVAALNPRVKTVVANSPGADFRRMVLTGRSNPLNALITAMSPDQRETLLDTMSYFDPVFLASRVRVPVLISVGMRDDVTPPETAYALKNGFPEGLVVSIVASDNTGHVVTPEQSNASLNWLTKFLIG